MKSKHTETAASRNQDTNDIQQRLRRAILEVEKRCGAGALMRLDGGEVTSHAAVSTGSFTLDRALGIGGFPRGRVIEIFGPESSGKTTLALSSVAQAQAAGLLCAFVDAEHALDPAYARLLGVNTSELLISQPDYGEQALEIARILIQEGGVQFIVIDSVAALVPKAEIEGEMEDSQVGLQARLMSKGLRKLTALASRHGATVIFINQIRMKIGVMFGSPETTPGGQALKFFSSVRLEIRRGSQIKQGDEVQGHSLRIKVVKNKMAPPFRNCEVPFFFGRGIDRAGEVLETATDMGIVKRSGAWYSYGDTRLGQGREAARKRLSEEPAILKKIIADIESAESSREEAVR